MVCLPFTDNCQFPSCHKVYLYCPREPQSMILVDVSSRSLCNILLEVNPISQACFVCILFFLGCLKCVSQEKRSFLLRRHLPSVALQHDTRARQDGATFELVNHLNFPTQGRSEGQYWQSGGAFYVTKSVVFVVVAPELRRHLEYPKKNRKLFKEVAGFRGS